jgi:hypothetical protein
VTLTRVRVRLIVPGWVANEKIVRFDFSLVLELGYIVFSCSMFCHYFVFRVGFSNCFAYVGRKYGVWQNNTGVSIADS